MHDPSHSWTAVVLAAGEGKRMRLSLARVRHPGRAMFSHIVDAAGEDGFGRCVVIAGPGAVGL